MSELFTLEYAVIQTTQSTGERRRGKQDPFKGPRVGSKVEYPRGRAAGEGKANDESRNGETVFGARE